MKPGSREYEVRLRLEAAGVPTIRPEVQAWMLRGELAESLSEYHRLAKMASEDIAAACAAIRKIRHEMEGLSTDAWPKH